MRNAWIMRVAALAAAALLAGCGPLVVGAAGTVAADKIVEDQQGGEGLF